ncbi:unnamed protein product [Cunninghamella echinulata]
MTVTLLHYDILLNIIPYLQPSTLIEYATTCRDLCQPALRELWNSPIITTRQSFQLFMQSLISSILTSSSLSSPSPTPTPALTTRFYEHWVTKLTITFQTFQPISIHLLQLIIFNKLPKLTSLTLHNTFATIYLPNIQSLHLSGCILKGFSNTNNNTNHHSIIDDQYQILFNIQAIFKKNHQDQDHDRLIESSKTLPIYDIDPLLSLSLTDLSILDSSISVEPNFNNNNDGNNYNRESTIQFSDDHLYILAKACPTLCQLHINGFFSDQGIIHLANHCNRQLEQLSLTLPKNLIQSNTITQFSIKN